VRFAVALLLLVVLVAGVPRLFDVQTWLLVHAVRELGPIPGWRCAQAMSYVYDPAREQRDSTLLSEAPEALVLEHEPWLEVDQVEADLHGGDTLVSVHGSLEAGGTERRMYVLSPGSLQSVVFNQTRVCNVHLGNWQIVGEQELG
jgi:hypothetical protein